VIHLYVLFSFAVVLVSTLIGYGKFGYAVFILLCALILILFRIVFHSKEPFLLCLLFIFSYIFIYQYLQKSIENKIERYQAGFVYEDKTKIDSEGRIEEFPSYRFENNQYIIHLKDSETRILVFTQPHQKFAYLDTLAIKGAVRDVRNQDEQWKYYYQKLNVQYVLWDPSISVLQNASPASLKEKVMSTLFTFKIFLRNKSIERFSSHTSALVLGMLLGEKDEFSKGEKALFNNANLSHILVVSGYNISLIFSFIFILLKSTHRYFKISFSLFCMFFFVLLVGHDASVVRSALMGSIILIANIFHRKSSAIHTLFLVATLMLLSNPLSIFDAGFHLSFLATYSLLILPSFKKIPEYILTTVWVFGFVSLYILYLSGSTSLVGIVTNICVLVFVPIFMFVSFVSLFLSLFSISIGIDVLVLEIISRYIFLVTQLAQYAPRMSFQISPSIVVGVYAILLSTISFMSNRYTTSEFIERHYQKFVPQRPN
jgi:competence protein ComEC